jgi:hypothetical protein
MCYSYFQVLFKHPIIISSKKKVSFQRLPGKHERKKFPRNYTHGGSHPFQLQYYLEISQTENKYGISFLGEEELGI